MGFSFFTSRWARLALAASLGVAASFGLASCASTHDVSSSTFHRIRQAALLPAPTPLYADSPLTQVGRVSLEGGVSFAQRGTSRVDRDGGASAHVTPGAIFHARIAYRSLPSVEYAFVGEGAAGSSGTPSARDVAANVFDYTETFRLGPQLRIVFNPSSRLRVGASSAVLLGQMPWERHITSTTTRTTYDRGTVIDQTTSTQEYAHSDINLAWWANLAVFLTGDLGTHGSLLGGLSAQANPVARGSLSASEGCYTSAGSIFSDCSGSRPGEVSVAPARFVATAFLSGELRLGRVSLIGRLHVIALGPDEVTAPGRLGGGIDLRTSLGR